MTTPCPSTPGPSPEPCPGDPPFRIARDGSWHYQGSPIGRPELVRLFATVLRREADGGFWLVTPVERVAVLVEDAPFVAVELDHAGEGPDRRLRLRTNLDAWLDLGPDHPLHIRAGPDGVPVPYVTVRPGLDARLLRPVYYELVELGEVREQNGRAMLGVWGGGRFFALGGLDGC